MSGSGHRSARWCTPCAQLAREWSWLAARGAPDRACAELRFDDEDKERNCAAGEKGRAWIDRMTVVPAGMGLVPSTSSA